MNRRLVNPQPAHSPARPYCQDRACSCHTNVRYHEHVIHPTYQARAFEQAYRFYGLVREGKPR